MCVCKAGGDASSGVMNNASLFGRPRVWSLALVLARIRGHGCLPSLVWKNLAGALISEHLWDELNQRFAQASSPPIRETSLPRCVARTTERSFFQILCRHPTSRDAAAGMCRIFFQLRYERRAFPGNRSTCKRLQRACGHMAQTVYTHA